jgi:hypothetical protein
MGIILGWIVILVNVPLSFGSDSYSFTTIDFPGASLTLAYGINDADQIVGQYVDESGGHGFLYNNGSFVTIDYPGASSTGVWGSMMLAR